MKIKLITTLALLTQLSAAKEIGVVRSDGSVYQSYVRNGDTFIMKCSKYAVLKEGETCEEGAAKNFGSRNEFLQTAMFTLIKGETTNYSPEVIKEIESVRAINHVDQNRYEEIQAKMKEIERFSEAYPKTSSLQGPEYLLLKKEKESLKDEIQKNEKGFEAAQSLKSKLAKMYSQIASSHLEINIDESGIPASLIEEIHSRNLQVPPPIDSAEKVSFYSVRDLLLQNCSWEEPDQSYRGNWRIFNKGSSPEIWLADGYHTIRVRGQNSPGMKFDDRLHRGRIFDWIKNSNHKCTNQTLNQHFTVEYFDYNHSDTEKEALSGGAVEN